MLYVLNTYQDMDSFEINKIIAAILLTALIVIGIGKIVDVLFYVEKPKLSAYKVEGIDNVGSTQEVSAKTAKVVEAVDIKALLAMGDVAHGEKVFKKCSACHMIAADGKNKIGPNLWGVIGRTAGAIDGYNYSKAMTAYAKEWTFEEMNSYLKIYRKLQIFCQCLFYDQVLFLYISLLPKL